MEAKVAEKLGGDPRVQAAAREQAQAKAEEAAGKGMTALKDKTGVDVMGADGKFDQGKARAAAQAKVNEAAGRGMSALRDRTGIDVTGADGKFDQNKAKTAAVTKAQEKVDEGRAAARAKAEEAAEQGKAALREKLGDNAHLVDDVMGEGGLPDVAKVKSKAQDLVMGGFGKLGHMFTEPGGAYEALGAEMLADADLDGLEMGLSEYEVCRSIKLHKLTQRGGTGTTKGPGSINFGYCRIPIFLHSPKTHQLLGIS